MIKKIFESKTVRKIAIIVAIVIVAVIAAIPTWAVTRLYYKLHPKVEEKIVEKVLPGEEIVIEKEVTVTAETIESGLADVGTLNTAEYYFTHVTKEESQLTVGDVDIPLTESYCIYSYDGVVTAGMDFTKIEVTVDQEERLITVKMPEVEITGCEIDENSFELFDEKSNIFNPIKVEDYAQSFNSMKRDEKQKAINRGILTEAEKNAKTLIKDFMNGLYDVNGYQLLIEGYDHS